jgi:hypothetical protein
MTAQAKSTAAKDNQSSASSAFTQTQIKIAHYAPTLMVSFYKRKSLMIAFNAGSQTVAGAKPLKEKTNKSV